MTTEAATIERLDDTLVFTLRGEVDAFVSPDLRREFREVIDRDRPRAVVVDLEGVTFLDSSGLGALVGALRRLREYGGQLRIVRPAGTADRIFELTGLAAVLDLYSSRVEAISAEDG